MMRIHLTRFLAAAFMAVAALATPALAHDQQLGDLLLHHPWARATPGGAKAGAAYLRIENHGDTADTLIGASADIAALVEIHMMSMENDMMVMGPAGEVEIPAHGTVELKPHGLHIMLMGLKRPLKEGETVPVTITFARAGSIVLEVKVEAIDATGEGGMEGDAEEHSH
ncbi:MAG: copper chaperone PCu(A)C [Rhodospirillaceae bacterium]|nr:copper chaperone PCu(A)C [Rhodospirillaceae bacterium]